MKFKRFLCLTLICIMLFGVFSVSASAANLKDTEGIPQIYYEYITALKAAHPNWTFEFYDTGLSWADVISGESAPGLNAIQTSVISYRSTSYNYNASASEKWATVNTSNSNLNLRSSPSTSAGIIAKLSYGTQVKLLDISGEWYYVTCGSGTGYVKSEYLSGVTGVTTGNVNLRSDASTNGSPTCEIPSGVTVEIYDISGNWYHVNCSYGEGYLYNSYVGGIVSSSVGYTPIEGSSWYQAHGQVIQYYMDPRNFLTEDSVFQFEKLSYDASSQTLAGVEAILKGSFMDGQTITSTDGRTVTYAQAITEAGVQNGISPYHIASRIIQEVGKTSPTAAATGAGLNGEFVGIYNFYNIGANTGIRDGLSWASSTSEKNNYGRPWDTPYKSIFYGAAYIANNYISVGQDTLYTQKFDIIPNGGLYNHQYMSNVQAPKSEASKIYSNYKSIDALDSSFVFIIPVYRNMPVNVCSLPAASSSPNLAADTDPVNPGSVVANPMSSLQTGDRNIIYRLYNPNSGEHFYTSNYSEKTNLVSLGWNYEGIGWYAPLESSTPVYRLYNKNGGEHHYTASVTERDRLVSLGWNYEGVGFNSDDAQGVPIYRQYNPNAFANNHNFTASRTENDRLVSYGWRYEGVGWYGAAS